MGMGDLGAPILIIGMGLFLWFIAVANQHAIQIFLAGMWALLVLGAVGTMLIGLVKLMFS